MDIIGGGTPKTTNAEYWNGTIPWLSVKDFNNDQRYVYTTEKSITELGLLNSSTKLLDKDDTIISARGTVGELAMIPFPMAFNQSCYGLRAKNAIVEPVFLYYLLKYHIKSLKKNTHGSVFDTITRDTFSGIEVDIPTLEHQKQIAEILGSLDDKIELNKKSNENLLAQADLLYDHIFSDEKNFIELGNVIETTSGGTPSRKHPELYENSSIFWVKSKELNGGFIHDTEEMINEIALSKSAAKILPAHCVLVAMYGATVGEYGIIALPMTCNQAICALIPNDRYPYPYLYELIRHSKEKLKNMAVGSAQQNISQVLIKQLPVHANIDKVEQFSDATIASFQMIETLTLENIRLAFMRDTLLPKLMSNELDVSDIQL